MDIGTITTAGHKGQIVIPAKMRELLHIGPDTPLQITLSGDSVFIHPISDVIRKIDGENSYVSLLKKTQGAWGSTIDSHEKRLHTVELSASKKRKIAW
jgi:AbrB family looped-hinge helix DNA binding protein